MLGEKRNDGVFKREDIKEQKPEENKNLSEKELQTIIENVIKNMIISNSSEENTQVENLFNIKSKENDVNEFDTKSKVKLKLEEKENNENNNQKLTKEMLKQKRKEEIKLALDEFYDENNNKNDLSEIQESSNKIEKNNEVKVVVEDELTIPFTNEDLQENNKMAEVDILKNENNSIKNHHLFFENKDKKEFGQILKDVQEYISSKYSTLILDSKNEETKAQVKKYINKYLLDNQVSCENMSSDELLNKLYTEMAEYSFLTKYIFAKGIEEININSWEDIEIQYSNGENKKIDEKFENPEHAVNVIRRMLHTSGMILDNASPIVLGHLSKNIRIAVLKSPIVDSDVGICASIRIVNSNKLKKENFVEGETATEEMLYFLYCMAKYGISICVAGATSSGKTTVLDWLIEEIKKGKRIVTIENGSREFDIKNDENCSVIHLLTRESDNEKQSIDQEDLLDMALRLHPNIIVVGEMRSSEAYSAQEAARTGHTVLTSIHSNSCEATYRRMVTLCKRKYDIDDETLMSLVTEAFPIVIFAKQLENKKRKIMEIMECEILENGSKNFKTLFKYDITENKFDGEKFIINGSHKKISNISKSLEKRLIENGMPAEILEELRC